MKSNKRQSRWMQLGVDKSNSPDRSRISSSRYTPKRQPHDSDKDFTLNHLNSSQNFSGLQNSRPPIKTSSQLIHYASLRSLSDKKDKVSQQLSSHHNHEKISQEGDNQRPKNKRILKKKTTEENYQNQNQNIQDPLQDNFRSYLHTIERMEKQLQIEKMKIKERFEEQEKQIFKIRDNIMRKFSQYSNNFENQSLKKILLRHNDVKKKRHQIQKQKIIERITSQEQFKELNHLDININNKRQVSSSGEKSRTRSIRSKTGAACQGTFQRIFQTIEMMKQGLNQFKGRRISSKKEKKKTFNSIKDRPKGSPLHS